MAATVIAACFALGFYSIAARAMRRAQRQTGRSPLPSLRAANAELIISAGVMWLFPLVLVLSTLLPSLELFRPRFVIPAHTLLAAVVLGGGLVLQYVAMRTLGPSLRIGIDPRRPDHFVQEGPYRHVRHPIYTSFLSYYLGAWLLQPSALFAVVLPIAVVRLSLQAAREERALLQTFGAQYAAYMRTTSRFILWIW